MHGKKGREEGGSPVQFHLIWFVLLVVLAVSCDICMYKKRSRRAVRFRPPGEVLVHAAASARALPLGFA